MKKYKKISAAIMALLYFSCAVMLTALHHAGIVCSHDEEHGTAPNGINHECVSDDAQCPICAAANLPKLSNAASVFVPAHSSCIDFIPKALYTIFVSRPDIRANPYNAPPYRV